MLNACLFHNYGPVWNEQVLSKFIHCTYFWSAKLASTVIWVIILN